MDPSRIKNTADFRRYILQLAEETTTGRTLDEYLRALWNVIQQAREQQVTYALIGQLLRDAFQAEPLPFNKFWLEYNEPPDLHNVKDEEPYSVLQKTIGYQIADLHRMDEAGMLKNESRFMGLISPTGHPWYNFDPPSYLKSAVESLKEDGGYTEADWIDLAILLWLGQIYE